MIRVVAGHLIFAKIGVKYDFSSTQFDLPKDLAQSIIDWGKEKISDDDVYSEGKKKGRENEMHITLVFGIHDESPDKLMELVQDFGSFEIKLGEVSRFIKNKKFDVVKIDIESEKLKKLNKLVVDNIRNKQTYPIYNPHCTIAYVNKGKCTDLSGNKEFFGQKFEVNALTFSSKNGKRSEIRL